MAAPPPSALRFLANPKLRRRQACPFLAAVPLGLAVWVVRALRWWASPSIVVDDSWRCQGQHHYDEPCFGVHRRTAALHLIMITAGYLRPCASVRRPMRACCMRLSASPNNYSSQQSLSAHRGQPQPRSAAEECCARGSSAVQIRVLVASVFPPLTSPTLFCSASRRGATTAGQDPRLHTAPY